MAKKIYVGKVSGKRGRARPRLKFENTVSKILEEGHIKSMRTPRKEILKRLMIVDEVKETASMQRPQVKKTFLPHLTFSLNGLTKGRGFKSSYVQMLKIISIYFFIIKLTNYQKQQRLILNK